MPALQHEEVEPVKLFFKRHDKPLTNCVTQRWALQATSTVEDSAAIAYAIFDRIIAHCFETQTDVDISETWTMNSCHLAVFEVNIVSRGTPRLRTLVTGRIRRMASAAGKDRER